MAEYQAYKDTLANLLKNTAALNTNAGEEARKRYLDEVKGAQMDAFKFEEAQRQGYSIDRKTDVSEVDKYLRDKGFDFNSFTPKTVEELLAESNKADFYKEAQDEVNQGNITPQEMTQSFGNYKPAEPLDLPEPQAPAGTPAPSNSVRIQTPDGVVHSVLKNSDAYKKYINQGGKVTSQEVTQKQNKNTQANNIPIEAYKLLPGETIEQWTSRLDKLRGGPIEGTQTTQANPNANQNNQAPRGQFDLTGLPANSLEPGMKGAEVTSLQEWLIRNGFNIPSGPTGNYGPETKAAVAALQKQLGVDPGQYPGYYGNLTKSALIGKSSNVAGANTQQGTQQPNVSEDGEVTEPKSIQETATEILKSYGVDVSQNANPQQRFIDTYQNVLKELGLSDLRKEADKYTKEYGDLENELNDKIAEINENPWLTEGVRVQQIDRMKSRYETRLNTLSNQQKLFESLYEQGLNEARYLTTGALGLESDQQNLTIDAVNKAMEIAEKQQKAAEALDTQVVDVNGRKQLINSKTGEIIKDLGQSSSGDSGGGVFTPTQRNVGAANAGLSISEFNGLDEDTKNYFVNGFGTFASQLNKYNSGDITEEEMSEMIASSNLSDEIKTILYQKAGITPNVSGASTGNNFGQTVGNLLGDGWNLIGDIFGF